MMDQASHISHGMGVIRTRHHEWYSQRWGNVGPRVLLIHGTGASTDSWKPLCHELMSETQLIAIDLPGHGKSRRPPAGKSSLEACVSGLKELCDKTELIPDLIVGHSAGAAIAVELAQTLSPRIPIVCINAAFGQFPGLAGVLFPYIAKIASALPFTAEVLSRAAQDTERTAKILKGTGSRITEEMLDTYSALFRNRRHVQGTLQLMADWDLDRFLRSLDTVENDVTFICGEDDKTVPAAVSQKWAKRMRHATLHQCAGYGHLIHEEAPEQIAEVLRRVLCQSYCSESDTI